MVYLPDELVEDLRAAAYAFERPMTAIVEEAVASWASRHRQELDAMKGGAAAVREKK